MAGMESSIVSTASSAASLESRTCAVCSGKLGKRYLNPRQYCHFCAFAVCGACSKSQIVIPNIVGAKRACLACTAQVQDCGKSSRKISKVSKGLRDLLVECTDESSGTAPQEPVVDGESPPEQPATFDVVLEELSQTAKAVNARVQHFNDKTRRMQNRQRQAQEQLEATEAELRTCRSHLELAEAARLEAATEAKRDRESYFAAISRVMERMDSVAADANQTRLSRVPVGGSSSSRPPASVEEAWQRCQQRLEPLQRRVEQARKEKEAAAAREAAARSKRARAKDMMNSFGSQGSVASAPAEGSRGSYNSQWSGQTQSFHAAQVQREDPGNCVSFFRRFCPSPSNRGQILD